MELFEKQRMVVREKLHTLPRSMSAEQPAEAQWIAGYIEATLEFAVWLAEGGVRSMMPKFIHRYPTSAEMKKALDELETRMRSSTFFVPEGNKK